MYTFIQRNDLYSNTRVFVDAFKQLLKNIFFFLDLYLINLNGF